MSVAKIIISISDFSEDDVRRFWLYVQKTDDCWIWTGTRDRFYGKFHLNGREIKAHRASFVIHGGVLGTLLCCHHCDVPLCVRPDHLFAGTHEENIADSVAKGRHNLWQILHPERIARGDRQSSRLHPDRAARGSMCGQAKLNESLVAQLRAEYATGTTSFRKLAAVHHLSDSTLENAIKGKSWKHVPMATC